MSGKEAANKEAEAEAERAQARQKEADANSQLVNEQVAEQKKLEAEAEQAREEKVEADLKYAKLKEESRVKFGDTSDDVKAAIANAVKDIPVLRPIDLCHQF